jgi:hydrogenase-4 component B
VSGILLVVGLALMLVSGLPSLLWRGRPGRLAATATLLLGALVLIAGIAVGLADPNSAALTLEWSIPFGRFAIDLDLTSALFLIPIALVPVLAAIYGHGYIDADPAHWPPAAATQIRVFLGLLAGSLGFIVIARDAIVFLVAWEGMALGSFFLITVDDRDPATRAAGWVYLIATHVGILALFAMFALLGAARGDTALLPLDPAAITALAPIGLTAVFVLALVGFGLKAGLMPLHVWLPPAHAAAPSHASAMLSGVVTKAGIYGLVRVLMLLPDPPLAWGVVLVILGSISAVAALTFAIGQSDVKRMLAYSTIENIGIITIGVGIALVGRSLGQGELVALGLGGAALHILAHSLMKTTLFFGAGAIIHATGTRNLERMGGLAKRMPHTARLFAVGALAICALPPLSGFASELLIYLGVFHSLDGAAPGLAALAAPALALTGALALATFVRAFGIAFLGEPRTPEAAEAHESPRTMLVPMALASLLIAFIGLAPALIAPLIDGLAAEFARGKGSPPLAALAPLTEVTIAGFALALALVLAFALLRRRITRTAFRTVPTWDCGYAAPTPRMQYTASSFGTTLVGLFQWLVHPSRTRPTLTAPFPAPSRADERVPDVVLDRLIVPAGDRAERAIARVRILQDGRLHIYILYVLIAVLGLFLGLGL